MKSVNASQEVQNFKKMGGLLHALITYHDSLISSSTCSFEAYTFYVAYQKLHENKLSAVQFHAIIYIFKNYI